MKNMELTRLRRMVNDEIERRKKVNNCLDKDDVLEYLKLVKMSSKKLDVDDIRDKTKTLNIAASNKFKKDIKNL